MLLTLPASCRMSHLFTTGDIVCVAANTSAGCNSDGGRGWIKSLNDNGAYDIEHVPIGPRKKLLAVWWYTSIIDPM